MAWAFEVFAGFDAFYAGGFWVIYTAIFFFMFGYLGNRGHAEDPLKEGLKLTGYSMLWGFMLALSGIPSMWVGILLIAGYGVLLKYLDGLTWQKWMVSFTSLCINFTMLVLVPEIVRPIFTFALVVLNIFIHSEKRVMTKQKDKEKKK